ncbi:MAG: hypothetical protein AB8G15_23235 [Saprospiraceae bacterium]
MSKLNWKKYTFEFFSMFIAIILAFGLNNWNDNRRDHEAAVKILTEISNGLKKDLEDIEVNVGGHEKGIKACVYWRKILANQAVSFDSLNMHYLGLTRDFFSAQNVSGYETLKSRGLELLKNDSLRFHIISLYEYDYNALKFLEENYYEMQFQANYYQRINDFIAPNLEFDSKGNLATITTPLKLNRKDKNLFLSYLWKIQVNRNFILYYYRSIEEKIHKLLAEIAAQS